MIILGLLLVLAAAGLSVAAIVTNDGVFSASAGPIELFGRQVEATVGQVFLAGAAAGALVLLGVLILVSGMGRSARRRAAVRRELNTRRQDLKDLQRRHDAVASDLAAHDLAASDLAAHDLAAHDLAAQRSTGTDAVERDEAPAKL